MTPKQNTVQSTVSPSITQNSLDASDWRNVSRTIQRTVRIAAGKRVHAATSFSYRGFERRFERPLRRRPGSRTSDCERPRVNDLPRHQHRDRVAQLLDLGEDVRNQQDRLPRGLEFAHDLPQQLPAEEVEALGRLVEDEQVRVVDRAPGPSPSRWTIPLLNRAIGSLRRSARPTRSSSCSNLRGELLATRRPESPP